MRMTGHIGKKAGVGVKVDVQLRSLKIANGTETEVISSKMMCGKNSYESR